MARRARPDASLGSRAAGDAFHQFLMPLPQAYSPVATAHKVIISENVTRTDHKGKEDVGGCELASCRSRIP